MRIELLRSGGFAGLRLQRSFDTAAMPPEAAAILEGLVQASKFFALQEKFTAEGADQFQYRITVTTEDRTHTVEASERAMPPPLAALVKWLLSASRGQAAP